MQPFLVALACGGGLSIDYLLLIIGIKGSGGKHPVAHLSQMWYKRTEDEKDSILDARYSMPDVRRQRTKKTRYSMPDTRCSMPDVRGQKTEIGISGYQEIRAQDTRN